MTGQGSRVSASDEESTLLQQSAPQEEPPSWFEGGVGMKHGLCALALLGLGLFFCTFALSGILYIHEASPSPAEIIEVLSPENQMPFYLTFVIGLIGAVCSALILGAPSTKPKELITSSDQLTAFTKRAYTAFLLGSLVYTWWGELQIIKAIFTKINWTFPSLKGISTLSGLSNVFGGWVRVLLLIVLQISTGPNTGRLIDVAVIMIAYHDRLNFVAVHDRELLNGFAKEGDCWNRDLFHRTFIAPERVVHLVNDLTRINGLIFQVYCICILLHFFAPAFIVAFYFIFGVLFYFWVLIPLFAFAAVLRVVVVIPLMRAFPEKDPGADPIMADGFVHCKFNTEENDRLPEMYRAISRPCFFPGGAERRFPFMLFNSAQAAQWSTEQCRDNYDAELRALESTGLTRDGWFWVIAGSTLLKFALPIVVTVITRFLAGVGYLSAVTTTLSERHWYTWIGQYQTMGHMMLDILLKIF